MSKFSDEEIFNEIDRRAIEEQRKYMEEVHKLIEGKDRYDAWIILREHGIHVDPYELPENEPPLTCTCRVMSLKEYGIVLAPDELPEEEQIKVLERRKKCCKNYMELKQIDRELNLLKRGRRKNGRFNQQKSIN